MMQLIIQNYAEELKSNFRNSSRKFVIKIQIEIFEDLFTIFGKSLPTAWKLK